MLLLLSILKGYNKDSRAVCKQDEGQRPDGAVHFLVATIEDPTGTKRKGDLFWIPFQGMTTGTGGSCLLIIARKQRTDKKGARPSNLKAPSSGTLKSSTTFKEVPLAGGKVFKHEPTNLREGHFTFEPQVTLLLMLVQGWGVSKSLLFPWGGATASQLGILSHQGCGGDKMQSKTPVRHLLPSTQTHLLQFPNSWQCLAQEETHLTRLQG